MTVDYWDGIIYDVLDIARNGTGQDRDEARRAILEAAQRVRWWTYRETVERATEYLRELLREDPDGYPDDLVYEAVDGFLTYTSDARDYLRESKNADAFADEVGDVRGVQVYTIATYALMADLLEEVGDLEAFAVAARTAEEEVGA